MKFGVVRFPGSCDDVDAQLAASRVGEAVLLWHADRDLQVIPLDDRQTGRKVGPVKGRSDRHLLDHRVRPPELRRERFQKRELRQLT